MPVLLPEAPALVAGHGRAVLMTADGEFLDITPEQAGRTLRESPPILVHASATFRRLGLRRASCFDLLELFAFVLPARSAAPTPRGLALALDVDLRGSGLEAEAALLPQLASVLLERLARGRDLPANRDVAALVARMGRGGWGWAEPVLAALGQPSAMPSGRALRIWERLPEWQEAAPPPPPSSLPVTETEARARLAAILGPEAEQRPSQSDYAAAASAAFAPREQRGDPHLVLAEAGTGTGKTLAYIAPASLWAERNRGAVWISTFTRHLQRQIDAELSRLFPEQAERRRRVVVRKGRENYLCLLNYEDAVREAGALSPSASIPLGLIARWAMTTSDGDIQGGDLPGWFAELFGAATILRLADRRGECIHAACPHWRRCYVEHTIRRAHAADLVVANHALVMAQAAWGGLDDESVPSRYVFDEGHHLFDAADGAFAAVLSGAETAELRRWLRGAEGTRSRARGLRTRLSDLCEQFPALLAPLEAALQAALALPAPGWSARLAEDGPELGGLEAGQPNASEAVLRLFRRQVLARSGEPERGLVGCEHPDGRTAPSPLPPAGEGRKEGASRQRGALECDLHPVLPGLREAADRLNRALARIVEPLRALRQRLAALLDEAADDLDSAARNRIEALCRSLQRRALAPLGAWSAMLEAIAEPPPGPGQRPDFVLFLRLDRRDGADRDAALHRHWLDPTVPFAATLAAPAHGLLVTSATLRDGGEAEAETSWSAAEERVGAPHLPSPAIRVAVPSPFDYAAQTRALIVTDVMPGDPGALAGAYRALFLAAGGGALGLFTAINRLVAVHGRIAPALEAAGLPLYAQHVDAMDNATLVDVFRAEEESCLLGTDAMRDGVDVPGRALRLVVFEKVPWPRPDILHRERRLHLSGGEPKSYDDRVARLRLRQAFGRLIRRATDRGVFVLLDRQTPSRLLSAFPPGVAVRRVGLSQAVMELRNFLEDHPPAS